MPTIDERIVQMRFDNQQFEQATKQSMSTLDKFKQALNFNNAVKGLNNLENMGNKFQLNGITTAVDQISAKFSAMEIAGITALTNITNKAVDTGVRMVKALSVDQISAGWQKYNEFSTSVGTLVSQGMDLDYVNDQMARLNWFTDETSYNFIDMSKEIGKFTATGQSLDDSVTAMEGIALWAAMSGQNAGVASRAMYQLSQAISKGSLRYDDWRSIQNASMDTKQFREEAAKAAVAVGSLRENVNGTYDILNANGGVSKAGITLNELFSTDYLTRTRWFNTDAMMKVFKRYSGAVEKIYDKVHDGTYDTASEAIAAMKGELDEFELAAFKAGQEARTWKDAIDSIKDAVSTGWMNTFKWIFGDYEEATKLWTAIANEGWDIFASGGERRNEILKQWHEHGGYQDMIDGFANLYSAIKSITTSIGDAVTAVFPPVAFETLTTATHKFKKFTEGIKEFVTFTDSDQSVKSAIENLMSLYGKELGDGDSLEHKMTDISNLAKITSRDLSKLNTKGGMLNLGQDVKNLDAIKDSLKEINTRGGKLNLGEEVSSTGAMKYESQLLKLNEQLANVERRSQHIKDATRGLASVFDLVIFAVKTLLGGLKPLTETFGYLFDIIVDGAGALGRLTERITGFIKESGIFQTIANGIAYAIQKINVLLNPIVRILRNLWDEFSRLNNQLGEAWEKIKQLESVQELARRITNLKNAIKSGIDSAFFQFSLFLEKLTGFKFADLNVQGIVDFVDKLVKKINEFLDSADKAEISVGKFKFSFESIGKFFDDLWKKITVDSGDGKSLFQKGYDMTKSWVDGLIEGLGKTTWEDIMGIIGTGSFLVVLFKISRAIDSATRLLKHPKKFMESLSADITTLSRSLSKVFNSMANAVNADALFRVAQAIGLITGAILALSAVGHEDIDALAQATAAIAIIMGGLVAILAKFNDRATLSPLNELGKTIAALKKSIRIVSFGVMATAVSTAFLMMSVAIQAFVHLFKDPSNLTAIDKAVKLMGAIGTAMTVISLLVGGLNLKASAIIGFGIGLQTFAVGLMVMAPALQILSTIDGNAILSVAGALTALLGVFTLFNKINQISKDSSEIAGRKGISKYLSEFSNRSLGLDLIAFAGALLILTPALKAFGENADAIGKAILPLSGVLVVFTAAVMAIRLTGTEQIMGNLGRVLKGVGILAAGAGVGFLAAAKAIEILGKNSKAVKNFSKMIDENKDAIFNAVAIIVGGVIAALAASQHQIIATIIGILTGIGSAVALITDDMMADMLNTLYGMINHLFTLIDKSADTIGRMIARIFNSFANIIRVNKDIIIDAIFNVIDAFVELFETVFRKLGFSKGISELMGKLTALGSVILLITKYVKDFKNTLAGRLSTKLFDAISPAVLHPITSVQKLQAAIGRLSYSLSDAGHTGLATFAWNLSGLVPKIAMFTGVIGGAVAIAFALANAWKGAAEAKYAFSDAIEQSIKNVDEYKYALDSSLTSFNNVAASIDVEKEKLEGLVTEYRNLVDANGVVKEGYEERAQTILNQLASALGVEVDWVQQEIMKYDDLSDSIQNAIDKKMAYKKLDAYEDVYQGAIRDQKGNSSEIVSLTGQIAANNAKRNELLAKAQKAGYNSIEGAGYLVEIGVINKNNETLKSQLQTAQFLGDQYADIIENYTEANKELASGNIDDFYKRMDQLTEATSREQKFSFSMSSFDELSGQLDKAVNDWVGFQQLMDEGATANLDIDTEGLNGDLNYAFEQMAYAYQTAGPENAKQYADAFNNAIASLDPYTANQVISKWGSTFGVTLESAGIESAEGFVAKLAGGVYSGSTSINEATSGLLKYFNIDTATPAGIAAESFIKKTVGGISNDSIKVSDAISEILAYFTDLPAQTATAGEDTGSSYVNSSNSALQKFMPSLSKSLLGIKGLFKMDASPEGAGLSNSYASGAGSTTAKKNVMNAVYGIVDAAITAGGDRRKLDEFFGIGQAIPDGVTSGIFANTYKVASAAASMIDSALEEAKRRGIINSPSKLFARVIGLALPEGTAEGVLNNTDILNNAMDKMMDMALNAAKDASDGVEFSPVITPVLDSSMVQSGVNQLNSLLSSHTSMIQAGFISPFMAQTGNKSAEDAQTITNTTFGDVNVNVIAQPGQDVEQIADAVEDRIVNKIIRKKGAFAT